MKSIEFLKEIRSMSVDELKNKELALAEELMKLRFNHALGHLTAKHRLTQTRRDIARVKTIIRERSLSNNG